jgi:hypothetical protein
MDVKSVPLFGLNGDHLCEVPHGIHQHLHYSRQFGRSPIHNTEFRDDLHHSDLHYNTLNPHDTHYKSEQQNTTTPLLNGTCGDRGERGERDEGGVE